MPRGSNGVYVAPAGTSAVTRTQISSSAFNTLETDIGSELTNSVDRLGRGSMQAALNMGAHQINAVADGTAAGDAINLGQLQGWDTFGSIATGEITINGAAGTSRQVLYQTSGSARWLLYTDPVAESGGNAGSDFKIGSFADDGVTFAVLLTGTRTTGVFSFANSPTVPTPGNTDDTQNVATTAYVQNVLGASPALGGVPTSTTPASADNSLKIATTAHVKNVLGNSPALGGNPTTTTQAGNDNSTKIATTAMVQAAIPASIAATTALAVGSYAGGSGTVGTAPGGTIAGSALSINYADNNTVITASGTWQFMGSSTGSGFGGAGQLWLRIA